MSLQLIRITSISVALTLLCGCVGVMVYTPAPERTLNPPFNTTTKREVIRWYGEPDEIKTLGNIERWRIKSINISDWCGVLVAVGIGIPLILPVCDTYSEWDFEGDRVVGNRFKNAEGNGFLCGAVGQDSKFTCISEERKR